MMKKQQKLIHNTPSEEADIARGIAADPDTFVPSDEQFATMKSRGGRPRLDQTKVAVTIRYTPKLSIGSKAREQGGKRA